MAVSVTTPQSEFSLTFDGPAIEDGRMSVADLAPALLALGDLFQEANSTAYPGAPAVSVEVRAFRPGSFQVYLNVTEQAGSLIQQAINLLNTPGGVAAANLITYVTAMLGLALFLRRKQVTGRSDDPVAGTTTLVVNNTTIVYPTIVVDMYQSDSIRQHAKRLVSPLTRPGIDELRLEPTAPRAVAPVAPVTIRADDVDAFDVPTLPEVVINDRETEMVLNIASVSFAEGNKWRLSDGDHTFWASIDDEDYVARVERGEEAFRKGDMLRCSLRIRQWQGEEGLQTEYRVVRVLEHVPAARTLPLFPAEGHEASPPVT